MSDRQEAIRDELLIKAVSTLREHFDEVQIIGIAKDDDGSESTTLYAKGSGSIYARLQALREYLIREEERTRERLRQEMREDGE